MTSISKLLAARIALGGSLVACSCQHDSGALFDDSQLPGPASGGGLSVAGSEASVGADSGDDANTAGSGDSSAAGSEGEGGNRPTAGTNAGAGKPGAGEGGSGGADAGMPMAGGGTGGSKPEPEPVTITITELDDAHVASCWQYLNFGDAVTFNVDSGNACVYQALLKPSLTALPAGSLVSEATLTLHCVNVGDQLEISYVAEAWTEAEVRFSSRPAAGSQLGELECKQAGAISLDLTAAVRAWAGGEQPPHGLYLRTDGENGTDFASSEATSVSTRPTLTITYQLPVK